MEYRDDKIIKVFNIITALIFIELVLGGLGHILGLPIRKVLFAIGIIFSIYIIYREKIKVERKFLIPIIVVLVYVVYGSIVGIINGNTLSDIFSDVNAFLGIIYILLLTAYINGKNKNINKILSIFINCSVVVAILTIILFFTSRMFLPDNLKIVVAYNELNSKLQYGFISGLVLSNNYARIYLYNGIFMQLGAAILFIKLLNKGKCGNGIIKLSILLIGIYVSNTRGFWLGTIGVIIISFIYYIFRLRKDKLTIRNIIIAMIPLLIVAFIIPKTIVQPSESKEQGSSGSIKDRIESIADFENDESNKVRAIQLKFLVEKIKDKPITGWGFGAHIDEYLQYMEENKMQNVSTTSFELYYVELLFKTGFLGIIIFFGYLMYNFIKLIMIIIRNKLEKKHEQTLVGWTIGTASILASSITNPYIAGLSVFFVLVMEVYLIQFYETKY